MLRTKNKNIIWILVIVLIGFRLFYHLIPNVPLNTDLQIDKIVVIKHKRILQLHAGDSIIKTYKISLGRVPEGRKEIKGDKKTPQGLYYISDKNLNSAYYKSLGISYPNEQDIEYAKNIGKSPGGHIKIHSLKNGLGWIGKLHLLSNWTQGCIALTNKEIDELFEIINIGTSIEIEP